MRRATATQANLFDIEPPAEHREDWHEQMLAALGVQGGPAWPDRFGAALRDWLIDHNQPRVRTLSLFSGGGGLDIAFHDAGFDVLEMVEIEAKFAATLRANTGAGAVLGDASVRCIDIRDYEPPANLAVDFIIGGPPCQTFSAAGRRASGVKGTSDPRGTLFEEYVRLLRWLQPVGFLFENVYGITGADGGSAWREIQDAFRATGYVISYRVLDTADYGVPQHRERLFIVGIRADRAETTAYHFPRPTHGPDAVTPRPFYTAGEAVRGANPTDETSLLMRGRWGHLIDDIPTGLNYSFYTREMGHPNPVFAWRSKFSDFMYKADPDAPVRTIKAQGGAYTGPFSWENRHFSTGEMKRLQTFPDDYQLVGKRQVCLNQIGNSVPPQIGRILALSILHQVFGGMYPFPMHYLGDDEPLGFRNRKRALTEHYGTKARAAFAVRVHNKPNAHAQMPTTEVRSLTDKFALSHQDADGWITRLDYGGDASALSITGTPQEPQGSVAPFAFLVTVEPAENQDWHISLTQATLRGSGRSALTLTALWKAFEERIAAQHGIADLVQLSGYYQYQPKLRARLEIDSPEPVPTFWRILREVIAGVGVSDQCSAADLAKQWDVHETHVVPVLHTLRTIGYEIRNTNTNSQIAEGEYLIPYAFPTLTPRSIQLRRKL